MKRVSAPEIAMLIVLAVAASFLLFHFGPSITGFVTREAQYSDNINLVVTENGNYTLNLKEQGSLRSLKVSGRITSYGNARAYLESSGKRYLIFDGARLNASEAAAANETNLITGFAVQGANSPNAGDAANKSKNKKPKWQGPLEFVVNGTIEINLSQHFIDEEGDTLVFAASEAEGIEIYISNGVASMKSVSTADFNTTITLTASDGVNSESVIVGLTVTAGAEIIKQNQAPYWNSDVDEFTINGTAEIDMSLYFFDEENDILIYNYGLAENISASIDGNLLTLEPADGFAGNASAIFTAYDGVNLSAKSVTLIVLNVSESINITPAANETINGTANETQNGTKTIIMDLAYNHGTVYDANDNGEESVNGVVDLAVEGTKFSWGADKSKACTRWSVYDKESGQETIFCNGNAECCGFIGLLPTKESWNETYYSAYGKDGSGYDNIVSAQVIYYDVNLSIENPKSEIYFSGWKNLSVRFFRDEIEFFDVCIETCTLEGLNKSSYTIVFETENGAILDIESVSYILETDVQNQAPVLLKNISTTDVHRRGNARINLSEHFNDPDNDSLSYSYYTTDGISMVFENDIAVVSGNWTEGEYYTYIIANDSEHIAISNVFIVNVTSYNETANYSSRSNLAISYTNITNLVSGYLMKFTANFTDFVNPINGSNINCSISYNYTGSWSPEINMSFNTNTKVYEYNKTFTRYKISFYNITCNGVVLGYNVLQAIDNFVATPALNCSEGCFNIGFGATGNVSSFDSYGNLFLRGNITSKIETPSATLNSFIVQNSSGGTIAYINKTGSIFIRGNLIENLDAGNCVPQLKSFIIQNKSGDCVAYINSSGDLWLRGMLLNGSFMT